MQENNLNYPKFRVCVRCFTFNQSKYITDALNGFTMQQTDFPFICCIVDDASTDGEQQVIMDYVREHFNMTDTSVAYQKETDYAHITYAQHKENKNCYFAVLLLKENHYSQRKDKMPYLSEWRDNTEYEALCEGDDYWIHPQKLQMQVDFLDENKEYVLACHRYKILDHELNRWKDTDGLDYLFKNKDGIKFGKGEKKVKAWLTKTLTLIYRKDADSEFYTEYNGGRRDTALNYFLLKQGKGYCSNEIMGVYRLNNGGICGKQPMLKKTMDGYLVWRDLFRYEQNGQTRYYYYSYYATLLLLTKGKILFEERVEVLKLISVPYFLVIKLINMLHRKFVVKFQ